jgi:hypothetical protein
MMQRGPWESCVSCPPLYPKDDVTAYRTRRHRDPAGCRPTIERVVGRHLFFRVPLNCLRLIPIHTVRFLADVTFLSLARGTFLAKYALVEHTRADWTREGSGKPSEAGVSFLAA